MHHVEPHLLSQSDELSRAEREDRGHGVNDQVIVEDRQPVMRPRPLPSRKVPRVDACALRSEDRTLRAALLPKRRSAAASKCPTRMLKRRHFGSSRMLASGTMRALTPPSFALIHAVHDLLASAADLLLFTGLSWALWRALGRAVPIAVLPIIIGLVLAATGVLPKSLGIPAAGASFVGWIGVLLLAFSAGLETRQTAHLPAATDLPPARRVDTARFVTSAMLALLVPFAVGTLAAKFFFLQLPGWAAPRVTVWWGAVAIGLCLAVSALPVLIGIVRELGPLHRPLTRIALRIAVLDDAVLWIGLALLLLAAEGQSVTTGSWLHAVVGLVLAAALLLAATAARKVRGEPSAWTIWLAMPLFLAAGAWSSTQLGLHELLGAYFAGALVPAAWVKRLPVERLGQFALIALAPLFFGHSGLKIDGNVLGWASLQASATLLVVAVAAKLVSVVACRPVSWLSRREAVAVGALLQCKGLMEIVAATILRDKGLLSEHAFAALVTLAVLSTLLTGPAFRFIVRRVAERTAANGRPAAS
jgi:Kef-type K+ transport system membrane component KefB